MLKVGQYATWSAALCILLLGAFSHAAEEKTTAGTIAVSAEATRPLPVGSKLPDAKVRSLDGKEQSLAQVLGGEPAALVFYRGGWCPYCNEHLKSLKDAISPLRELGVTLVAVSPDLPEELRKTMDKQALAYTLVSDAKMSAAKALGIAFKVDDGTVEKYKGYGIDLEAVSGETHHALPVPSVFLVDATGTIRFVHANPDYKVRLENDKLIAAANAMLGK